MKRLVERKGQECLQIGQVFSADVVSYWDISRAELNRSVRETDDFLYLFATQLYTFLCTSLARVGSLSWKFSL